MTSKRTDGVARPLVRRPIRRVWRVIAVLASGHSPGHCAHDHATQDEAERCPWTPDPWPEVCDLFVRQVRDCRGEEPVRKTRRMQEST